MALKVKGWYKADCLYSKGTTTVSVLNFGKLSIKLFELNFIVWLFFKLMVVWVVENILPADAMEKLMAQHNNTINRIIFHFGNLLR